MDLRGRDGGLVVEIDTATDEARCTVRAGGRSIDCGIESARWLLHDLITHLCYDASTAAHATGVPGTWGLTRFRKDNYAARVDAAWGDEGLVLLFYRHPFDPPAAIIHVSDAQHKEWCAQLHGAVTQPLRDPLTGLIARLVFPAMLDDALTRARDAGRTCALLGLNLDHLKAVNDIHGFDAGDAVLREVAAVLRDALPTRAQAFRTGGDEVMALLPDADQETACAIAEHVRLAVQHHPFGPKGGVHLTCSIGVVTYPDDVLLHRLNPTDRGHLLMLYDDAIHAAKNAGGDETRCARDPDVLALGAWRQTGPE